MSYGADGPDIFRQSALVVTKILQGGNAVSERSSRRPGRLPGTGARMTHQAQKAAAEDYRRSSQRMAAVI
jgi:hypothetical protein